MTTGLKSDYMYPGNMKPSKVFNVARHYLLPKTGKLKYYPRRYAIDPSTVCNLRCRYCIQGNYDEALHFEKKLLPLDDFKIIFDKIKKYALLLQLHNFGEPLLNPDLPKMISYATKAGVRCRLSSNMAVRLDDQYIHDLVTSGLFRLTCCIDGHDQQTYEQYRTGGKLDTLLENLEKISYYKKKLKSPYPILTCRMLVFEWNHRFVGETEKISKKHNCDEFVAYAGSYKLNDKSYTWSLKNNNWQEKQPKIGNSIPPKAAKPCAWLFTALYINSNGKTIPCCFSGEKKAEHLSLLTHSLEDVWNSEQYINSRLYTLGLIDDRSNVLPLCRTCRML